MDGSRKTLDRFSGLTYWIGCFFTAITLAEKKHTSLLSRDNQKRKKEGGSIIFRDLHFGAKGVSKGEMHISKGLSNICQ